MSKDHVSLLRESKRAILTRSHELITKKQQDHPASDWKSTAARHAPEFWDSLTKIYLTRAALREFCRRNALKSRIRLRSSIRRSVRKESASPVFSSNLQRFARNGGPDLSNLIGYTDSSMTDRKDASDQVPDAEAGTDKPSKPFSHKISAYDRNFLTVLAIANIHHPECDHIPANFEMLQECLKESKNSISPIHMSDDEFRSFRKKMRTASNESKVMTDILPTFMGDTDFPRDQNRLCENWTPINSDLGLVIPKPDFFDGEAHESEYFQIRKDLNKVIIPSKDNACPYLPNFFGEFKGGPGGIGRMVAERQACYDGAFGARGMHRLQNYTKNDDDETYDQVARTFTFVYFTGVLTLYAHHLSQPDGPKTSSHYHMNELDSWLLSKSQQQCAEGITAWRNLRVLAHELRKQSLDDADQRRARQNNNNKALS